MRRRAYAALLTCLALLAGALACAAPASAAAADEVVYVADSGGGQVLHVLDRSNGSDTVLPGSALQASTAADVRIVVSRDGRKIACTTYRSEFGGESLSVYDRDTGTMRGLGSVGPDAGYTGLAWLPDNKHLLVGPMSPEGRTPLPLQVIGIDGTVKTLPQTIGIRDFDVSPSGLQVVYSVYDARFVPHLWVANVDGTSRTSLGIVGSAPRWSHGGSRILARMDLFSPDDVQIGTVMETFTPAGTRRSIVHAAYLGGRVSYGWSADDSAVLASTGTDVRELVLAAGTWSSVVATTGAGAYAGPWSITDRTAPVIDHAPELALEDSSVRFAWGYLTFTGNDVVGLRFSLAPGLVPPATYAAGTRRTTSLGRQYSAQISGLLPGATYSYAIWALDASGNASVPVTGHLRLVGSTVMLSTAPIASTTSTGGWIRLVYGTTAAGAAGVIIEATTRAVDGTSSGHFTPYYRGVQLQRSGVYYFGRGGYPEALVGGTTYTICGGTRDEWGNPHWSSTCTSSIVPVDDRDRRVAYAGSWARLSTTGAWLGTTSATSTGGSMALTVAARSGTSARRFTLLATTSPTGGRFRVYVDGRYVTTVSTRTSTTLMRRPVWTSSALTAGRSHSVRIVQVAGSGWVRMDGIAVALQ